MEGMDPLAVLAESRLLPLLTVRGGEDLLGLARVLEEEGVGVLEITLRTEKGLEALKALRKSGLLLGAGTVRSPKEAEAALEAHGTTEPPEPQTRFGRGPTGWIFAPLHG